MGAAPEANANLQFDQAGAVAKNPEKETDQSINEAKTITSFTDAVKKDVDEIRKAMESLPENDPRKAKFETDQQAQLRALDTDLQNKQEADLQATMTDWVQKLNAEFADEIKAIQDAQKISQETSQASQEEGKNQGTTDKIKDKVSGFAENMIKEAEKIGLPKDMIASILKSLSGIAIFGNVFRPIYERVQAESLKEEVDQALGTDHHLNNAEIVKLFEYYEQKTSTKQGETTAEDLLQGAPTFGTFLATIIKDQEKPGGGWTYDALRDILLKKSPEERIVPPAVIAPLESTEGADKTRKTQALDEITNLLKAQEISTLITSHKSGTYPDGGVIDTVVDQVTGNVADNEKEAAKTAIKDMLNKPETVKLAMQNAILLKLDLKPNEDQITINNNDDSFELTIKPTTGDSKTVKIEKATADGDNKWKIAGTSFKDDDALKTHIKTIKTPPS